MPKRSRPKKTKPDRVTDPTTAAPTDRLLPTDCAIRARRSKALITRMRNRGDLVFDADGTIAAEDLDKVMSRVRAKGDSRRPDDDRDPGESEDYYLARARREIANADLAELKREQLRGDLVDAAESSRVFFARARIIRDRVLNIPTRISNEIVALAREGEPGVAAIAVESMLSAHLRDALTEAIDA